MSERVEDTSSRGEMTLDPAIASKIKRDANGLFAAFAQ